MYRHVLVPIDCSAESRQAVPQLGAYLSTMVPCQVTLVAVTSPATDEAMRFNKMRHAREALNAITAIYSNIGVYTRHRIVEGVANGDMATALASIVTRSQIPYDLILLSRHQTHREEFDVPCSGSLADRICGKVNIPVLVLPTGLRDTTPLPTRTVGAKDIALSSTSFGLNQG